MNKKATTKKYLKKCFHKGFSGGIEHLIASFMFDDSEVNLDKIIPYTEDMLATDKYLL